MKKNNKITTKIGIFLLMIITLSTFTHSTTVKATCLANEKCSDQKENIDINKESEKQMQQLKTVEKDINKTTSELEKQIQKEKEDKRNKSMLWAGIGVIVLISSITGVIFYKKKHNEK